MSRKEAAATALKLLLGGVVSIGIIVEESIATIPVLAPFASLISGVFVALATGLATVFSVWLLDKADLFSVESKRRHEYVVKKILSMTEESYKEALKTSEIFDVPQLLHGI